VDAHRYRGNGAGAMATLRTAALNLLRLARYQSIRAGIQAVMHVSTALLPMVKRQPKPTRSETLNQPWGFLLLRRIQRVGGRPTNSRWSWKPLA